MLIHAQNSNKTNYKIQDCFANRQIKQNVKCNSYKISFFRFTWESISIVILYYKEYILNLSIISVFLMTEMSLIEHVDQYFKN
jgi:hypothetical protein